MKSVKVLKLFSLVFTGFAGFYSFSGLRRIGAPANRRKPRAPHSVCPLISRFSVYMGIPNIKFLLANFGRRGTHKNWTRKISVNISGEDTSVRGRLEISPIT